MLNITLKIVSLSRLFFFYLRTDVYKKKRKRIAKINQPFFLIGEILTKP